MSVAVILAVLQVATPASDAVERVGPEVVVSDSTARTSNAQPPADPAPDSRDARTSELAPATIDWIAVASASDGRAEQSPAALLLCVPADACSTETPLQQYRVPTPPQPDKRGVLIPMYASFAVLQALDVHSTRVAIGRGAVETNPLARGLVHRPAAFIAVKAGAVAGTVFFAEQLRPRSRVGAIVLMGALNSLYATVVANNYRVAARQR